jgi:hypothetical protein
MIQVRDALDVAKPVLKIEVRNALGVAAVVKIVQVRDAEGVARTVFEDMTVSASPSSVNGAGSSPTSIPIVTQVAVAEVNGGIGPHSYAWTRTDGGPGSWTITAPTSAATAFRGNGIASGADLSGEFVCTGTDANGTQAVSPPVSAFVINYDYS